MKPSKFTFLIALALSAFSATQPIFGQNPFADLVSWPFWGGNISNTHSSLFDIRLRPDTVPKLNPKWVFTAGGEVTATPTVDGNALYVPDWGGNLFRINNNTGQAVWSHKVADYTGISTSLSRTSPAISRRVIVIGDQASGTVIAVDKVTGAMVWKTLVDPHPAAIITTSPVIYNDRVYVGVASTEEGLALTPGYVPSFRGSVVALDVSNGSILWSFKTVPQGYTGGSVWGSNFAVDLKRNSLYVSTGNNYSEPDAVTACVAAAPDALSKQACLDPQDYIDAVISLDLNSGAVKWTRRVEGPDDFTVTCIVKSSQGTPCPNPAGPDYDFGSAPNLITTFVNGQLFEVVGVGQKSGVYWTFNPDSGDTVWATQVGPGGTTGGIEWGSATDGQRIYVAINNSSNTPFTLANSNQTWNAGSWAALDIATGKILWQVPATGMSPTKPGLGAGASGQMSAAFGVVFAGSLSGDMVAMNASNGLVLWKYTSAGSVICGPSIVGGRVYWGSGYSHFHFGKTNNQLFAFEVPEQQFSFPFPY